MFYGVLFLQIFVCIDSLSSPQTLCPVPLRPLNPKDEAAARLSASTPNWQKYLIQLHFLVLLTELARSCTQLENIAPFGCYTTADERHACSINSEVSGKIKGQNSTAVVGKSRNTAGWRYESTGMRSSKLQTLAIFDFFPRKLFHFSSVNFLIHFWKHSHPERGGGERERREWEC